MKLKKSLLAIAMASATLSSAAFADDGNAQPLSNGSNRIELRIKVAGLNKQAAAPSVYTKWVEISAHTDHTPWTPDATKKLAEYQGNQGTVEQGSSKDVNDPDFAQTRDFTVDEERYEQPMVYDGDGDAIPDGSPIRHTRTVVKQQHEVAAVTNGAWSNTNNVTCTNWSATGNASRYLTPWTETAAGQTRDCEVNQESSNNINDADSVNYPYPKIRKLIWTETSSQQGLMDNRSCKTLLDYYNANKKEIQNADSSWSHSGWKKLNIDSSKSITTHCNSGWTMVVAQFENSPVAWSGGGFSNGSNLYNSYASQRGFALNSSYLPSHSKFGVGLGGSLKYTFSGRYTTENLNMKISGYTIHRNTGYSYLWHNPKAPVSYENQWKNTLTIENDGNGDYSTYDWAFSPNASASCSRGYAMTGGSYGNSYQSSWAWTVYVY